MAIETSWYVMDGKLGVNLNKVITSVTATNNPSQPEYPGFPHNLGDRVQGNNGSEWMLVRASATVSAFNTIQIGIGFGATNCVIASSSASATSQYVYGVAQFQLYASASVGAAVGGVANAQDLFWALMKANGGARLNLVTSISAGPGVKLYPSLATPGHITTTATLNQFIGIVPQASASAVDTGPPGALECALFTYPFPGTLVSVLAVSLTA